MNNNPRFHINHLAILGVGLIGGSLARALKRSQSVNIVSGYGRRQEALQKGIELGVLDRASTNLAEVVSDADIIMLATPLGTVEPLLTEMKPYLKSGVIISDAGSAKGSVVRAAKKVLGDISCFVPGHPIAGTEKSGVEASFAELFDRHRVILTPDQTTTELATDTIRQMWQACGADVVLMGVEQHDRVLAATSHLPHMLAYALVDCLANMDESEEIFKNAAGGFADFTRIASSNPEMWHDICFANRESLLSVLDSFDAYINRIRAAIDTDESDALMEIFKRAKAERDAFMDKRQAIIDAAE